MSFFGKFLDGPLAGFTFEAVDGDSGGDIVGGIMGLGMIAVIIAIIACLIVGPIITWPIVLHDENGAPVSVWIFVLAVQILYILLRIRRCVKYWHVNFFKELCFNVIFLAVFTFVLCAVLIVPASIICLDEEVSQYIISHYGEILASMISRVISQPLQYLFFYYCLSAIPAIITTLASKLICNYAIKKAKC